MQPTTFRVICMPRHVTLVQLSASKELPSKHRFAHSCSETIHTQGVKHQNMSYRVAGAHE